MIQGMLSSAVNGPPNYDIFGDGQNVMDCASFAQGVLNAAGVYAGSPTDVPSTLINQLQRLY